MPRAGREERKNLITWKLSAAQNVFKHHELLQVATMGISYSLLFLFCLRSRLRQTHALQHERFSSAIHSTISLLQSTILTS